MTVYYFQSYNGLIVTTKKNIEQTLVNHAAIRKIINKHYIPEVKRLKEEKILDKDYMNPFFTSGTLLTQTLHEYTKPILLKKGEEPGIYKLASLNPLNLKNKATQYERDLFESLAQSKEKTFTEIIKENNNTYLLYAEFFPKMKARCMQCHSTPDKAPKRQVEKYGTTHGYNYKVGDPSALITMRAPLDASMEKMRQDVIWTGLIVFLVFLVLFVIGEFVIHKINKQREKLARNKEIRNLLIKESQKDPLTGLLNRRPLRSIFETEYNRSKRDDKNLVVLLIDVDYFKKFNDQYGHLEGDYVLKVVADLLSKCFNRSHEHVFRYGGEEFAVISSDERLKNNVLKWTKNFQKCLGDECIEHTGSDYKCLTVSIGVYKLETGSEAMPEIEDVIEKADKALYKAKEKGRNQTVIYNDEF